MRTVRYRPRPQNPALLYSIAGVVLVLGLAVGWLACGTGAGRKKPIKMRDLHMRYQEHTIRQERKAPGSTRLHLRMQDRIEALRARDEAQYQRDLRARALRSWGWTSED